MTLSWSSLLYVTTLPSLVVIDILVVKMFLICYVIPQDHVVKGSYDFISNNLSRKLILELSLVILPSLVATGNLVVEICFKFVT